MWKIQFLLLMIGLLFLLMMNIQKQQDPIFLTDEEIDILLNEEHLLNAEFPIDVSEVGIEISESDEQKQKVESSISFTVEGIVNRVIFEQP